LLARKSGGDGAAEDPGVFHHSAVSAMMVGAIVSSLDERIGQVLPLWAKLAYALFLTVIVPAYWVKNGLANFLWFSDIALIVTGAAVWLESSLLASAMALGVFLPESLWNVSFFGRLLTGARISSLADYMFDARKSRFMRALSLLLHVVMPATLIWMLTRLGYDSRALVVQSALAWVVLPLTYAFTDPTKNINWVFGFGHPPRRRFSPRLHLVALMVGFPVVVYVPTHLLLRAVF
jgi:predicted membrane protein